jgi:hypothetical protein
VENAIKLYYEVLTQVKAGQDFRYIK